MMRRAFSVFFCLPRCPTALPFLSDQTVRFSARCVASYPSPGTVRSDPRSGRKNYNYLNSKRLVENEKGPRSRRAIRLRDDVFFHRRIQFREEINKCIENEIRYFPENVKRYVFFKNSSPTATGNGFQGMRKAPGWVQRRILQIVEDEILKLKNRGHLVELIESTGTVPPTKEEWARYTDKKGRININLYHHFFVEKHLRCFCVGKKCTEKHRLLQAFLILNRNNFDVCPPLFTWSLRQGPVRDEELVERGSQKEVRDIIAELVQFQRSSVMRAFEKLSPREKEALLMQAEGKREELRREYEQERLFGSKLMCGVASLKEVRSMTSPAISYYNQEYYKYVIRCGGSVEATLRQSKDEVPSWFALPKETKMKYYCFERSSEMHPISGAHLYFRYCSRDYGLSREDSVGKWSMLSELQKAALNFCFYSPISAPRRSSSAFRRFYYNECYRHGLMMTGRACSNYAFLRRARKIWMGMSADERAKYEDTESFSSVFPLQPLLSSRAKGSNASNKQRLLESSTASASASTTAEKVETLRGRQEPVAVSKKNDAVEEEDDENEMFYFKDEIINDDGTQEENQTYDAKILSHMKLRTGKEEILVFNI
ncbi:hypothetical protein ECC02_009752 [Trypanosoma cruzi]|uniref:Uncharacterized protein n=1 Tax=Trypanosoma cruzi TaxID=5693 RepID=A0A7J6XT24_TRYCR|nr:hypothetical protein ECC02_009752 [Trypanosoma cruzi]